jgi:hypothetical protein
MDWKVAQAVECLLCKCKAQNSNLSPTKKEKVKHRAGGNGPVGGSKFKTQYYQKERRDFWARMYLSSRILT